VSCRAIRPRDLIGLLGDFTLEQYHRPESDVLGRGAFHTSLLSTIRLSRRRPRTYVAEEAGSIVAFLQFQQGTRDRRWTSLNAGYASRLQNPERALDELLRYAVSAAGSRGVRRLYVRMPEEAALAPLFRRMGFVPFTTETVYVGGDVTVSSDGGVRLSEQDASDTWAVHQLYNSVVPRDVQNAEALTSHHWDLSPALPRGGTRRAYLVQEGFQLLAYARVYSCGNRHTMEVLYEDDYIGRLSNLVRAVLAKTAENGRLSQVFIAVRPYQVGLDRTVEELGFAPLLTQLPSVKYTAARVATAPAAASSALQVELRERVPKQVPTFLHEPPRQEA
jgi:hypothetical protein